MGERWCYCINNHQPYTSDDDAHRATCTRIQRAPCVQILYNEHDGHPENVEPLNTNIRSGRAGFASVSERLSPTMYNVVFCRFAVTPTVRENGRGVPLLQNAQTFERGSLDPRNPSGRRAQETGTENRRRASSIFSFFRYLNSE